MAKYNIGDRVRVKSLDWYHQNMDEHGWVKIGPVFIAEMSKLCGNIVTISHASSVEGKERYRIKEMSYTWCSEFFEDGIVSIEACDEQVTLINGMDLNN